MTDIQALQTALPRLDPRSREFATSLIEQSSGQRGLSDKQWAWVTRLVDRANAPAPAVANIGSVAGIIALFDRAQQHLRRPAILIRGPDGDVRLSLAGARARVPGSINVTSVDRGDWYGRITRDGKYEPCREVRAVSEVRRGDDRRDHARAPSDGRSSGGTGRGLRPPDRSVLLLQSGAHGRAEHEPGVWAGMRGSLWVAVGRAGGGRGVNNNRRTI